MSDSSLRLNLQGKVSVVTGGGRGLGRAYATNLANMGSTVVVIARSKEELSETVKIIHKSGGNAAAFVADVTNDDDVKKVFEEIQSKIGSIDLLVNNAGVCGPLGPVWENEPEQWVQCISVNLSSAFLCSHAVLPEMINRRSGRIINIASGAGAAAFPYMSAYAASKTALIRYTETLAIETAEYGIKIFAMEPGAVKTKMSEFILQSPEGKKWMPWYKTIFDESKDLSADVAAGMILFLASGKGDFLSGKLFTTVDNIETLMGKENEIENSEWGTLRIMK